jgi:Tfp pilus assembly protein PilX
MKPLRDKAAQEDGFVMVVTMMVLMVALIVAGVAISDTVNARRHIETDRRAQSAQQAADTGLQVALYRANQMNVAATDFNSGLSGIAGTLSCLVAVNVSGYVSGLTPVHIGANTACPTSTTPPGSVTPTWAYERLGNRTTFAYQFIPGATSNGGSSSGHASLNPVIVAIGREDNGTPANTSDDVVRRVKAILNPVDPFDMIESTGDLTFTGATTTLNGDVRTNGDVTVNGVIWPVPGVLAGLNVLPSSGGVLRLAEIQYGGSWSGGLPLINRTHTSGSSFTRTPVSISPSKPDCGAVGASNACPSATYYGSATHKLTLTGTQSLTLGGGDYVFCGVSVGSSATLNTSPTASAPTRIFIDSPSSSRCTAVSSSGNLSLQGRLSTINLSPSALQIYMVGNGTPGGTTASIDLGLLSGTPAFFLYAPDTDVTMRSFLFQGNIIGHDVTMIADVALQTVTQDLNLSNLPLSSSIGLFTRKQYIQCKGTEPAPATPTADC